MAAPSPSSPPDGGPSNNTAAPTPATAATTTTTTPTTSKPIHSLVLDTGPLIKNDPPADVLRSRAEQLYILPSVIPEIRDAATRSRVETTLLPFVTVRAPRAASVKFISGFARRTGDLEVLSRPDLEVLALAYELECERNGGDWRLRNTPGQKTVNGRPPAQEGVEKPQEGKEGENGTAPAENAAAAATAGEEEKEGDQTAAEVTVDDASGPTREEADDAALDKGIQQLHLQAKGPHAAATTDAETARLEAHNVAHEGEQAADLAGKTLADGEKADEVVEVEEDAEDNDEDEDNDDDDGGWITPSNIKKHKAKDDKAAGAVPGQQPVTLQAAVLTSDFAMQNVALRMNLNLVSPSLTRISRLRTWVLRCHGCFKITRDMERQFCPTCGQPTLTRVACTVDDRTGSLTVHLKKNFQWNNRGNVYSVPKPVHGTANGKRTKGKKQHAGGQNGWGQGLMLAEDQKEFVSANTEQRRQRKKDLMNDDDLPNILTGDRSGPGGRVKVGAGRTVNSRKRR